MIVVLVSGVLALVAGYLLTFVAKHLAPSDDELVEKINALLPQTQCAQCGYPGCKPYAIAITQNQAPIDRCPPGGATTLSALAKLLDREPTQLQPQQDSLPSTARIVEKDCIGCTLCLEACPVDAIIGSYGYMHSVIEEQCTGCELCLPSCPMDCIEMHASDTPSFIAEPVVNTGAACIHCGRCSEACPVALPAHNLYQLVHANDIRDAISSGLSECILCEACDVVCPSDIPLTAIYRSAKQQYRHEEQYRKLSFQAQQRHQAHNVRLSKIAQQAEQNRKTSKALLKEKILAKSNHPL